jgi:hypothetical protein
MIYLVLVGMTTGAIFAMTLTFRKFRRIEWSYEFGWHFGNRLNVVALAGALLGLAVSWLTGAR